MISLKENKKGFISLLTVLTISAVAILMSSAVLLKSITAANLTVDEEWSAKTEATVDACAEHAMIHLASATTTGYSTTTNDWNYAGSESLSVAGNSCYIYPIDISGGLATSRVVHASSTVNNFTRKLSITVATNTPAVSVSAWNLVPDF